MPRTVRTDFMNKTNFLAKMKQKGTFFYWGIVILPILNYLIFFIGVNINNILMAFKEYSVVNYEKQISWVGFANFTKIFQDSEVLGYLIKNSLIYFAVTLVIIIPLTLLFAYYIFKKYTAHSFFKVMIFMPSIVCSMVLVIFYRTFVNEILDKIIIQPEISLIRKDETAMPIMLALHIIGGFSANILLFLNSMSQMSASVLEAARIDGASELRTFWSIVLPSIWGTIVEMIVIAMAGLATNQANLQAMYGNEATNTMRTVGYHIFVSIFDGGAESEIKYAYCSAFGLLATVVVAPATIFSRYLMNKLGPTDR